MAGDYLERLLDVLDYDGDIDLDVEAGRAIVSIDGGEDLDKLVGDRGAVLEALQELTRLAVQQSLGNRSRLMLDIAGWRRSPPRRADRARHAHRQGGARQSGEPVRLRPMTPFERKVVHDAVAGIKGVESESEGEEPRAPGRRLATGLRSADVATVSDAAPGPTAGGRGRLRRPARPPGAMRSISSPQGSSGGCSAHGKRRGSGTGTSSTARSSRSCSRTAHGRWTRVRCRTARDTVGPRPTGSPVVLVEPLARRVDWLREVVEDWTCR